MSIINHLNNGGTNLTSNTTAGATTSPVNAVPSISAPFYAVFDATNANGHYEVALITGKTATNINHAATTYDHTTAEEVRFALVAAEADALWDNDTTGWFAIQTGATLTYSSADDPTYVVTTSTDLRTYVQVGDRIKFANNSTTFYGIITATAAGSLTIYGGTDYDVANSAITSVYFSHMKSPVGFPMDPTKWQVEVKDTTDRSVAGTGAVWNNVGTTNAQITIPIGAWDVSYQVAAYGDRTTAGTGDGIAVTLSTANNSASDGDLTSLANYYGSGVASSDDIHGGMAVKSKYLVLASKTLYYLNAKMDNSGNWYYKNSTYGSMILRAVCAYL